MSDPAEWELVARPSISVQPSHSGKSPAAEDRPRWLGNETGMSFRISTMKLADIASIPDSGHGYASAVNEKTNPSKPIEVKSSRICNILHFEAKQTH
jgi:hypothetical protein